MYPPNKRSKIWVHYQPTGLLKAKCLVCQRLVSYRGGSTGNLFRHMRLKHGAGAGTASTAQPYHTVHINKLQEAYEGDERQEEEVEEAVSGDWVEEELEEGKQQVMRVIEVESQPADNALLLDHGGYTTTGTARGYRARAAASSSSSPSSACPHCFCSHQDESAAFGNFVSARLRQLPSSLRTRAYKRILDLLYRLESDPVQTHAHDTQ